MTRNYGSLNRRSGGSPWQWILIGIVMGFACSAVVILGGLATGIVTVDGQGAANLPTQTPFLITQIITATPEPITPTATATEAPLEVIEPTATTAEVPVEPTTVTVTEEAEPITVSPVSGSTATVSFSVQQTPMNAGINPQPTTAGLGDTTTSLAQNQTIDVNTLLVNSASSVVRIDGGTFSMGTTIGELNNAVAECQQGYGGAQGACLLAYGEDSMPQHNVTISPFSIETTEVSYQQYINFLNSLGPGSHYNACLGQPCAVTRNESETSNLIFDNINYSVLDVIINNPMANVTWYGAQAYCEAIGRRLPTEAEWELAARGINGNIYPWGNTWDPNNAITNRSPIGTEGVLMSVNSLDSGRTSTGLYNMAGSVAEWVQDWFDPTYYSSAAASGTDPQGPASGQSKVHRGGSWDAVPFFARSVHRRDYAPGQGLASVGFRCVQDANTGSETGLVPNQQPLGANIVSTEAFVPPVGTPDPASLGIIPGVDDSNDNAAPTLPPAPTQLPAVDGPLDPGT